MIRLPIISALRQYPFWPLLKSYRRRVLTGLGALILVDILNVCMPLATRQGIDAVPEKDTERLFWAGAAVLGIMLLQSVMRYAWRIFLIGTSHYIARDLRQKLYRHLQKLPLPYYQRVHTGDLMSRATNDIEAIREAVGPGVLVAADAFFMFLLIVPVMFWLSPKLTLLAFAFFPVVPWLTLKVGDKIDDLFERTQKKMSALSAFTQESFGAIRLIKSLVLENNTRRRFMELSTHYKTEGLKLAKYEAVFSPALSWITYAGTFLILLFGGLDVIDGTLSIGTFVAFQRFVVQVSWPMEAIGWAVTLNREGFAAYRRYNEILEVAPVASVRPSSKPAIDSNYLLKVSNLSFAYPSRQDFQLRLDSLVIPKGQKIGLVGPIGCGKSTLFQLLLRLYEPKEGTIYFDGKDIVTIPLRELRQKIAVVEQQIRLFSESVKGNVKMGLFEEVNDGIVHMVSQSSHIDEEIAQLGGGYDTLLGEKGVNLSGGQKQRLALSRALIRKPELLLLDDAFSAIDVDIENRIIRNLMEHHGELSLLVSSHRLSIMPLLDEIWVMHEGQIIATGSHQHLLRESPLYAGLWEKRKKVPQPREEVHA